MSKFKVGDKIRQRLDGPLPKSEAAHIEGAIITNLEFPSLEWPIEIKLRSGALGLVREDEIELMEPRDDE